MSQSEESRQQVIQWLKERGHNDHEIAHILDRLKEYEQLTTVDALMDAIAQGDVDLAAYVKEVRQNDPPA